MPTYVYQYRREQRALIPIEADSEEEADELVEARIAQLKLNSPDDTSDDPGETEMVEIQ